MFNAALGGNNVDVVMDFAHDVDFIGLDDVIFSKIGTKLAPGAFYAASGAIRARDADDRIIYNTANGRLYYDADGTKTASAPIYFASLTNKPLLDAGDFVIV